MELIAKRQLAYVYLLHRMFKGDVISFMNTMALKDVTEGVIRGWDKENGEKVEEIIRGEDDIARINTADCGGSPTIKSIKEKALVQINRLVGGTDDPARLAQVYKILSEFESTDEKKEKSVIDAVNENVKPLLKKDEETPVTMMDVLRAEGKAPIVPTKRRPGRPKKVISQTVNNMED